MREITVLVKPGSKVPSIETHEEGLIVRVRERAIEGAANAACIRALAAHFDVAPSRVTLLQGARSRRKRFRID
ncbi:MAG TPA: DUF167 domain-containing protein [Candidatus Aquilonibacter sp.]|nr:DUF167 domain-containing protein [Candidatus Aquilonibacter sp.]